MNLIVLKNIFPYLDWQSRLDLNTALPKPCRVITKFSSVDLLTHDFRCIINTIKNRLHLIEDTPNNTIKRGFLCKEIFVMLTRPRYRFFIDVNQNFKLCVLAKLGEFTNGTKLHKETNIPKGEAMEISKVARTVKKIILEKPFKISVDSHFIHNTKEDWSIIK
jgi:hypothetical protein